MAIGNVSGSFFQIAQPRSKRKVRIYPWAEHRISQNDKMHSFARIMIWNECNYFINQRLINLLTTVSSDYDLISVRFQERKIHYLSVVHYTKKIKKSLETVHLKTHFFCLQKSRDKILGKWRPIDTRDGPHNTNNDLASCIFIQHVEDLIFL